LVFNASLNVLHPSSLILLSEQTAISFALSECFFHPLFHLAGPEKLMNYFLSLLHLSSLFQLYQFHCLFELNRSSHFQLFLCITRSRSKKVNEPLTFKASLIFIAPPSSIILSILSIPSSYTLHHFSFSLTVQIKICQWTITFQCFA